MIKIDGTDYDTETLSEAAKAQLMNLQVCDQKIAATQQELAIQQTARNAYAQALQAELAKENWLEIGLISKIGAQPLSYSWKTDISLSFI